MPTTAATTRFGPSTMTTLVDILHERQLSLAHCVERLREESDALIHSRDVSDLFDHLDPSGDVDLNLALVLTLHAEAYLVAVERALVRFEDGSYGFCTDCGAGIPLDRLRVLPAAERCVVCSSNNVEVSSAAYGG